MTLHRRISSVEDFRADADALAIPKPRREDRKKVAIDTLDLAIPKAHYDRDADYRAWVKTRGRCRLHGYVRSCAAFGGRAELEAAHLDHGGRGIKGSDASCIPLCPVHHDALDAETIPWQIVAKLWRDAWELREEWHRRRIS